MSEKRLFLLDAYSLIYRSYFAFMNSPMRSSSGLNTSTIFGFVLALEDILKKQHPTHLAVAFDLSKPTFRHKMYPAYKAQRQATPEEIKSSVPVIRQLLALMNIKVVECEGFEADDVIGTLAVKAANEGFKVFMVTPDKDYCQLVSDNIFILKPGKSGKEAELHGVKEVQEIFMVKDTSQVIDILALWGDASDNVPGVPGVGEKTSKKLIAEFGSVENILENLDTLSPKQKDAFLNNKEQLFLSKKLVTISIDVPVDFSELDFEMKSPNETELKNLFNELNFRTLSNRFFPSGSQQVVAAKTEQYAQGNLFEQQLQDETAIQSSNFKTYLSVEHKYSMLTNDDEIKALNEKLLGERQFCFDTETTGLNPHSDALVGISISFAAHKAFYIPIPENREEALHKLQLLKPSLENETIIKIGHNLKFDILFLHYYNIDVQGDLFDTMLAHYLLKPEMSHKMDALSAYYLQYEPIHIEELIGHKGTGQLNMKNVSFDKITEYAAEDADITFQLMECLKPIIESSGLNNLFYNIECKLLKVLIEIEINGVIIDKEFLKNYSIDLASDIKTIENEIFNLAGQTFNIASPKQMGEILFEKMKIPYAGKLTKTKQYSTNEEVLQLLVNNHPIISKILEYRGLTKLLSTYVDALPKLINPSTGKVHTSFNQSLAVTGRLSSLNPNLQNIPIRDERGREIRKAFIPVSDENIILSADYSQIELRLIAHMSKDENMIEAFKNNADIHTSTASKVFKIQVEEVTKDQRSKAKTANFGIIYGISAFGLSQRMNIPRKEANELIEEYFKTFPGVKKYMLDIISFAKEKGYVETLMKRKRYLPDINSQNATVRGMAERNAINSPIQGTAADVIKLAMINISNEFKSLNLKSKMILQVHDELVFDVYKPELEKVSAIIKDKMENAMYLLVPLTIEIGTGNNWLEAH